jgi:magnesium transporter
LERKKKFMRRYVKKRKKRNGLLIKTPPSQTAPEPIRMTMMNYDPERLDFHLTQTAEECLRYKDQLAVTWINVDGVHDAALIARLGQAYGLHPLIIEDIQTAQQRPKIDIFDAYIFVLLQMHTYNEATQTIEMEQVSLVLGPNFVLTFQEQKEGDVFNLVRDQLRNKVGLIRKSGAGYLAYALIDALVDSYFEILERFGDRIELIEEKVLDTPQNQLLQDVHFLRRELIFLRKSAWPLRNVISELGRQGSPLIEQATIPYYRDLYDQITHVIDTIEIFRDMLTGTLDIYLSSASNRMNEIMKFLTIIGTIFIPLTFIVGVYGMNFHYMPELTWKWGYLVVWLVMVGIGFGLLAYFKKKQWL